MRWTEKPCKNQPNIDDHRIMNAFLWLPLRIGVQTRWLEKASWLERYTSCASYDDRDAATWKAVEWIDHPRTSNNKPLVTNQEMITKADMQRAMKDFAEIEKRVDAKMANAAKKSRLGR